MDFYCNIQFYVINFYVVRMFLNLTLVGIYCNFYLNQLNIKMNYDDDVVDAIKKILNIAPIEQ